MRQSFLHNFLKAPTSNIWIQTFRYLISGGTAFIVDYTILYLLVNIAGLHYQIAAGCGFAVGLLITYLMSVYWVFDERRFKHKSLELGIFALIGIIGLGLNSLFMWIFRDLLQIDNLLADKILTTIIVSAWNFLGKKLIVFSKR